MARIAPRTFQDKSGRTLTIRCVEPDEAAAMLEFAHHTDRTSEHNVTQPGERSMTLEEERDFLRQCLETPHHLTIAAYDGDRVVGGLFFRGNDKRRLAHHGMFGISVHAGERSKGIGAALIRALLDWAAAHPAIEKVSLQVFATNAHAQALYRKMGFAEECRRSRYIKLGPKSYVDDIEMSVWVK